MKFLLNILQQQEHLFQKGGKLEKLYPLYEAQRTFLFTPPQTTVKGPHIRDSVDMKRVMITVVFALLPLIIFSFYNTGLQTARAYNEVQNLAWWQLMVNGLLIELPIIITSYVVGGLWETIFAIVRKHPISEGFLVTGILLPLTLPPTVPLWQVAMGVSFGVVIGKEIFGGVGMNILNPALTARVFLFFAYPASMSGDAVWIKLIDGNHWIDSFLYHTAGAGLVEGFSGATALATAFTVPANMEPMGIMQDMSNFNHFNWFTLFIGLVPGSIGETSAMLALVGALILIVSGVGSWRIIVATIAGALVMGFGMNLWSNGTGYMALPPWYHLVMGGFMFGAVYMATDPVSATATDAGKWIYGFLIGVLCVLIRVWNPAYPEGMMLAILFMNIFAPLIDHFVVQRNIQRRLARAKK
ncbi:MAG: NADH:ubiquinone reductase (Na(+)-transporting) subunit B [Leptospiraceae bacterium]|nr:NADH:ubiquinone reductase (Na(+)-transporting) subunit B [Leptospiraceae bacterium]